ncbi:MAG: stage V sporulation protein AD [Lachnospirales bacterium]
MGVNIGRASVKFENKITIKNTASIVGKMEGESPLSEYFDYVLTDNTLGLNSWEMAESKILSDTFKLVLNKENIKTEDIDYVLCGDLLNQCSGSSIGIKSLNIPFFGIFGACSTFGEALSLGSIIIDSNAGKNILAGASSHFCSAEKQFRYPLDLGTQRPPTSTWTVTGAGAVILSKDGDYPYISGITTGKIVDYGITDANNMGSAMAPAAAETIIQHFMDFNVTEKDYDLIITGDLGSLGVDLLIELCKDRGYNLENKIYDCGVAIYDSEKLDTHCGGSGCACSATVFSGYIYNKLKNRELNKILFLPTGALMSTTSVQQGNGISGIAHCVVIENY